ncbi:hypothetical protein [Pseudomonas sp. RW3S2]|uniref:hypothetical protein n=1 Tax=Pseudomonas sp. RW3S2 TaxID=485884 RepID=UPI0016459568|nr:hypothetical protein [Pseudomonas sp. RW3S2]MBC3421782.1 hypothetical protein [Pseudomonas sp. RW3S2]
MSLLEDLNDGFDIQQGLNAAMINTLEILTMMVVAKLPAEDRDEFARIIDSLVDHEDYTGDLTDQGRQAYKSVTERISAHVRLTKKI